MENKEPILSENNQLDGINLIELLKAIFRNAPQFILITGVTTIGACIYALAQPRVWQGEFQIVLESGDVLDISNMKGGVAVKALVGSQKYASNLNTQLQILKSPSVLRSVYLDVKEKRVLKGEKDSDFTYQQWQKDHLGTELIKRTSVLKVNYNDIDKSIIIPTLNKISEKYKFYASKSRQSNLNNTIEILSSQIEKYKTLSLKSIREANLYAIKHDLSELNLASRTSPKSPEQKIRTLQSFLNILDSDYPLDKYKYLSTTLSKDQKELLISTIEELETINLNLAEKRLVFKESDKVIKNLLIRRNLLISTVKEQLKGIIKAQIISEQAILRELKRPTDVLLNYKELKIKALRDENTLRKLEEQKRLINLENAKILQPWQLITTPYLNEIPVSKSRRSIGLMGIFIGLIGGSLATVYREKENDLIYNKEVISRALNLSLLLDLRGKDSIEISDSDKIRLLAKGAMNSTNGGKIAILPLGNLPSDQVELIRDKLNNFTNAGEIIITNDLIKAKECSNQIIITGLGLVTNKQIQLTRNMLKLQGGNVLGWILLCEKHNIDKYSTKLLKSLKII